MLDDASLHIVQHCRLLYRGAPQPDANVVWEPRRGNVWDPLPYDAEQLEAMGGDL